MGTTRFDFTEEVVIVTGASSGIGRGIALKFGEAGATVINADLQPESKAPEQTAPTHERVDELGGSGHFVRTDVSNKTDIEQVVAEADQFGGLDVMVNNTGIFSGGRLESIPEEELRSLFEVNAFGVFYGCQAAARSMKERERDGTIVNIASTESEMARMYQTHYAATKGAVKMITRGAALELADAGIRVNAVAPGNVETTLGSGLDDETRQLFKSDDMTVYRPLSRSAEYSEIAPAVLFLASEQASYITGELLFVDGGTQIV